jgi:signal transduction histidine kinase
MDESKEGVLLIATTMVVLVAFALTVLAVMIIYRRRKLQHLQEIRTIEEKFSRELLEAQLEVQRQTMQHIGREIHDHVGQQLTLAFLYMQQMQPENSTASHQLQSIATIINESLADLRNLSRSLTNPSYLENGLDQLINLECAKVRSTKHCDVTYESNAATLESSGAVKSFVLRILQEFMQNSLKHSQCTRIDVSLDNGPDGLWLHASDNGKGFLETEQHSGIGLANMRKRATIIGGNLTLESTLQQGTRLKLFIPNRQLNFNHVTKYSHSR